MDRKIALKGSVLPHLETPSPVCFFSPPFSMCAAGASVGCQASSFSLTSAYAAELEGLGENAARVDSTLSPLC